LPTYPTNILAVQPHQYINILKGVPTYLGMPFFFGLSLYLNLFRYLVHGGGNTDTI